MTNAEQLTLSLGEAPVSHSQSQEEERDWMASLALCSNTFELFARFAQSGCYGKTYPEYCRLTEAVHSESYSMSWPRSGTLWHGDCLMLNSSVWPNDGSVCSLSEALQSEVSQRYSLTPKACRGILARSERRGKQLPPQLEAAIRETASLSEIEPESQGGRKGWLVQRNLSGSLLAHNDQVVVCVAENQRDEFRISDVCYTIPTRPGIKGTPLVLASDAANAEITCDISPTLLAHAAKGGPIVVMDE